MIAPIGLGVITTSTVVSTTVKEIGRITCPRDETVRITCPVYEPLFKPAVITLMVILAVSRALSVPLVVPPSTKRQPRFLSAIAVTVHDSGILPVLFR